jgi:hypothetical protein
MVSLEQFAEIIGVDIVVRRYAGQEGRWTAQLEHTDVLQGGCLVAEFGNGATGDTAMREYAKTIAGKRIAVNGISDRRQEFNVPKDLQ